MTVTCKIEKRNFGVISEELAGGLFDFASFHNVLRSCADYQTGPEVDRSVAMSIKHQIDTRWVVGSPETVTAKLRKLYEDVGGFGGVLMLHYDWEGDNGPQWKRSMELLATKVMPQLKDLTGAEAVAAAR